MRSVYFVIHQDNVLPMSSSQVAWIAIAIVGSLLLWVNRAIAGTFYSITELPFQPADLNRFGDVVGQQYLWQQGTLIDLRTFPGTTESTLNARGINDNGWVVGDGLRADLATPFSDIANNRGFVFNGSQITPIPPGSLPGSLLSPTARTLAIDANNQNQIVINEQVIGGADSFGVTVRIEPDGSRTPLFQEARFGSVPASAINNVGQVVGSSASSGRTGPGAAYLADGTKTTPLISSGYCSIFIDFIVPRCAPPISPPQPSAIGLNDQGQVVGAGPLVRANDVPIRALIWEDPATNPFGKDLGSFGQVVNEGFNRNIESLANSINNAGDIVGYAYAPNGERRAVIWQNGTLFDLNDRVVLDSRWTLTNAFKINEAGQIIGIGWLNGQETGFLLSPEPIPEPNQTLGTIVGVGTVLAFLRRKRRSGSNKKSIHPISNGKTSG